MRLAEGGRSGVLHALVKEEERGALFAWACVINKNRPLFHEAFIALANQPDDGLKQGMAWADEGCDGLLVDVALLKTDPFVSFLDQRTLANLSIAFAQVERDVGDLPPSFLAAFDLSAEALKGLNEEALDLMRIKALRFGAFHLKPKLINLCWGEDVVR